jgi:hypothetical protein
MPPEAPRLLLEVSSHGLTPLGALEQLRSVIELLGDDR